MSDPRCPFGRRKCEQCRMWLSFPMENIQTGEIETQHDCTFNWQTRFLRDQVIRTTGVQAATESFRNEMVKSASMTNKIMLQAVNKQRALDYDESA